MTGSSTAAASTGRAPEGGSVRSPAITFGRKPGASSRAAFCAIASGSRTISSARARCGSRRMKPRSSSAVTSR